MIKIPDTFQEVFDIVSKHLLKQKVKSAAKIHPVKNMCKYRGPNGLKCAAGILIPDEEYTQDMDVHGDWLILVRKELVENKFGDEITDLQEIHDFGVLGEDNTCYDDWKNKLTKFAQDNDLICNF